MERITVAYVNFESVQIQEMWDWNAQCRKYQPLQYSICSIILNRIQKYIYYALKTTQSRKIFIQHHKKTLTFPVSQTWPDFSTFPHSSTNCPHCAASWLWRNRFVSKSPSLPTIKSSFHYSCAHQLVFHSSSFATCEWTFRDLDQSPIPHLNLTRVS